MDWLTAVLSGLTQKACSCGSTAGVGFTAAQLPATQDNIKLTKLKSTGLTVLSSSLSRCVCSLCSSWVRLLSLSASPSARVSRSTWALSSLTSLSRSPTWLSHWDWEPSSFSRSSCLPCSSSWTGEEKISTLKVTVKASQKDRKSHLKFRCSYNVIDWDVNYWCCLIPVLAVS